MSFSGRAPYIFFDVFLINFRTTFFSLFCEILTPFGSISGMIFIILAYLFRWLILYRLCIHSGMDLGIIFDGFLMDSLFAHPPCKTFKFDDPYNEFTCFCILEKHGLGWYSWYLSISVFTLIFEGFQHRFWFNFRSHLVPDFIFFVIGFKIFFASYFYAFLTNIRVTSFWKNMTFPMLFFCWLFRYRLWIPFWRFRHRFWLHFGAFWCRIPWFVFRFGHLCFMYSLLILTHSWSIFVSKLVHSG